MLECEYCKKIVAVNEMFSHVCKCIIDEGKNIMTQCTKQFDPTKPCRTRAGNNVRIICTDRKHYSGYSIVALEDCTNNYEDLCVYQVCGHRYGDHKDGNDDLINISDAESELERVKETLRGLQSLYQQGCHNTFHEGFDHLISSLDK